MEKVDKANSRAKHAEEELGIPPIIACDVFLYRMQRSRLKVHQLTMSRSSGFGKDEHGAVLYRNS